MSTRFTVVIPTRERHDTLEWTLKTCVSQDYDKLEIIVSDNNSADGTAEVVHSFGDSRIRYLNPGRRLSMTDNFEFALSHVTGGFVTCIGDDDGLVPNALAELDPVIRYYRSRAITWNRQVYYWPRFVRSFFANTLHINLFQDDDVREVDAAEMLREVVAFRKPYYDITTFTYYQLPSIYNSFVEHGVIHEVIKRSGRFFHSITPDVYSSVAIASVLDKYHMASRAFGLVGASHHSNGATFMSNIYQKDRNAPTHKYLSENSLAFHPELVLAPSNALLVAECYLQARDHLGLPPECNVDLRNVLRAAIEDRNTLADPAHYSAVVAAVREVAAMHRLEEYTEEVIERYHYRSLPVLVDSALHLIFSPNSIFECDRFGVTNIYEASLTFDRLRRKYRSPLTKRAIYLANCAAKARTLAPLAADAARAGILHRKRKHEPITM